MSKPAPDVPRQLLRRYLTSFKASQVPHRFTDVLVLGTGVAGLSAALSAAEDGETEVLVVAKDALDETATRWAQGGVAAVLDPELTNDSLELHIADTISTAQGLANEEAVRITVTEGAERVRGLLALGAQLDRDQDGQIQYTLEGGHSRPRILHRGDTTGQEVERVLLEAVEHRPNITCLSRTFAVDLVSEKEEVRGAVLHRPDGELEAAWARRVVLATGGLGRLYRETTNPEIATGDGIAMAFRAGAAVADLEFVQFHPTTLYLAGADRFLITEAVRGEGGVLRDGAGERFMPRFHDRAELAPRDVVSRAIIQTMRQRRENRVWLDLSAIPPARISDRFPRIREILLKFGIDILKQPIPVRPSAHYSVGGVRTDLDGRTSVPGLFAAGEVSCTGLHGANRLASNSILEGLVFGHRAGISARHEARLSAMPYPSSLPDKDDGKSDESSAFDLADLRASLRSLLWHKVGLEREGEQLKQALSQIASWIPYGLAARYRDVESWTLQNTLLTAWLLTLSAVRREESRGVHFRTDFPERDDTAWHHHLSISRDELVSEE